MVNSVTNTAVPTQATEAFAGPGAAGGMLNMEKDAKEAQTAPKFGELWQQIQTKYGAKAEKPREIKKTLGKDDFLRIMITQMRHQDPTKPFDAEQMAAQMAQFASVEQLQNINQSVGKLSAANQPLEKMAMTNLIGKTVTIDRGKFPHTEGQAESLTFSLPMDAASVKVAIVNEQGEKVLEKDLGAMKKGDQSFNWDGNKVNTLPAKAGTYTFDIEALDQRGTPMQLNPQRKATVVGVSFEGTEPVLLVGDNRQQDKVTLRNVVRIDSASGAPVPIPGAQPQPQAQPQAAPAADGQPGEAQQKPAVPNLISFEKGVGSSNFDASRMTPEVQAALAKYQSQGGQLPGQAPGASPGGGRSFSPDGSVKSSTPEQPIAATGFPNGLSSQDSANNDETEKGGEE